MRARQALPLARAQKGGVRRPAEAGDTAPELSAFRAIRACRKFSVKRREHIASDLPIAGWQRSETTGRTAILQTLHRRLTNRSLTD